MLCADLCARVTCGSDSHPLFLSRAAGGGDATQVLTTMEKERRNPRSRANLKREEEVANKLMNTVMFVGRELESMQV